MDKIPTGNYFQTYINPQRESDIAALNIHGLTTEFLRDKPLFAHVALPFLEFIRDSPLVIHNAGFDMKFVNSELALAGHEILSMSRVIDTLWIARRQYPRAKNSLNALCNRFRVDISKRQFHGALLDSQLLAEVYVVLCSGRQVALTFENQNTQETIEELTGFEKEIRVSRQYRLTQEELEAHKKLIEKNSRGFMVKE